MFSLFIAPRVYRFRVIQCLIAAALLVPSSGPLWAAPEPLSLQQAQQIAAQRSTQLTAQDAAARAARDMALAAGQLPDPVLKLGIDNLPVTGPDRLSLSRDFMTMRRIGLMQELPREAKRKLKTERFERDAERAQAQGQLALATLQQGTALAWLEQYYAQATKTLLLQQLEEISLQEQGANIAFRQGRGSQADIFAARAAQIELDDRLSQIDRQTKAASLMLVRWIGPDALRPLSGAPAWTSLWGASRPELSLSADQLRQHPKLAASAALVNAAETDARLAQANTQSDWTVEAAFQQRGASFSNMVSIGLSVPLQWDRNNRQNREITARLAAVDEARANDEDTLRGYEADVQGLLNDWQTGKERVLRYNSQMIPVAGQRLAAALTAYRSGKGDLASVLAARREEINTRIQALSLELETARFWAQLNYLKPDNSLVPGQTSGSVETSKGQP
jgi:outer membrane protein TolC